MYAVIRIEQYDIEIKDYAELTAAKADFEASKMHDYRELMLVQIVDRHRGYEE